MRAMALPFLVTLAWAPSALAVPIVYTFDGSGTGSIYTEDATAPGGYRTDFIRFVGFVATFVGETDDRTVTQYSNQTAYDVPIAVGNGRMVTGGQTLTFADDLSVTIATFSNYGYLGFRQDNSESFGYQSLHGGASLAAYSLLTDFAVPFVDYDETTTQGIFETTTGFFRFDFIYTMRFTAQVVPVPAALPLMVGALGALTVAGRLRRQSLRR